MSLTLGEVLEIQTSLTSLSLTDLEPLRAALDRETEGLSLVSREQVAALVGRYVAQGDEVEAALRSLLPPLLATGSAGAAALLQGPPRCGKSHLLSVLALLCEYPQVWPLFLEGHPQFTALHQSLRPAGNLLIVPVPLEEHRGQEERLENIVFDRTERELARGRYGVNLPLSGESYALDLIERHALPRYRDELNEHVRAHIGGFSSWEQLRQRRPQEAITAAQTVARQIGYPLDFRQSRTERLSRLLQILPQAGCGGVVWMLDDLSGFLAAAGPKASHDDYAFLEFLGQRSRLEPVSTVGVLEESLEELGDVEPYLLGNLRSLYVTRVSLSSEPVRKVAHQALRFTDGDRGRATLIADTYARYQAAFGTPSFSEEDLRHSYPLHPLTEKSLEAMGRRYLGQADAVLQFFLAPAGRGGLRDFAQRDATRLLGPAEVCGYLEPLALMHPQAAPYFREALDFYRKNVNQLAPENPEAALDLVASLLVMRLAGVTAPVSLLAELLGPNESGGPRLKPAAAADLLETLRLMGSYVDVRRGPDPDSSLYVLEVQTNLTELVRQRLSAVKQGLADDDARLWRRVVAASDSPSFPLAELVRPQPYEVNWENSLRAVQVQVVNFSTLRAPEIAAYCQEAADPGNPEDCYLLLGQMGAPGNQNTAWQTLAPGLPATRWAWAVLAWIPRPLTPSELDTIKHCAACHELLRQPAPDGEMQAAWRGRLLEERLALDNAVRAIAQSAYYEGVVYGTDELVATAADLSVVKGDWTTTVSRLAQPALLRLFPEFPALAPRHPLTSRQQIDLLVDRLIMPLHAARGADDELDALAESVLLPLGLVSVREGQWQVAATGRVVEEVMGRIRQRDQAAEQERGRLLSCADLAQHLIKSALGLPPELFELTLAVLVRLGLLEAYNEERQALPATEKLTPFAQKVHYVARPALLPWSGWQVLSRVSRVVLSRGITTPGHLEQSAVWESLLERRGGEQERLAGMRRRLTELREALGQPETLWRESRGDLEAAEDFYAHLRPELPAAEGLAEFITWLEPHLQEGQGVAMLSGLLRRLDRLETFLESGAAEVVAAQQYIESPDLASVNLPELGGRRETLQEVIGRGEALVEDQVTFHRHLQIFLTTYQRRYLAWHSRVHRNTAFEQFRAVKATPEYRALAQLQPLEVTITHDLARVGEMIENYAALRCSFPDLANALTRQPTCPQCGLRLGQELTLPPAEDLLGAITQGLEEYLAVLTQPEFRQKVREYAAAMPYRRDLSARLEAAAELSEEPSPREIMQVFTDEVLSHLNRILAGKMVAPRSLGDLRRALEGRTLTHEEAQRLFSQWMAAGGETDDEDIFRIEDD
ncbi:MAG TPA: DUF6079 family protein [Armatimonadota bacterium]